MGQVLHLIQNMRRHRIWGQSGERIVEKVRMMVRTDTPNISAKDLIERYAQTEEALDVLGQVATDPTSMTAYNNGKAYKSDLQREINSNLTRRYGLSEQEADAMIKPILDLFGAGPLHTGTFDQYVKKLQAACNQTFQALVMEGLNVL